MRKLTKRSQQRLYAVSGMGVNLLNLMMGSYLCSALLVGGFDAKNIPFHTYAQKDLVIAATWAMFVTISKIIDGVIDIPLASFTDRLKSRWGRRRPSIAGGLVVMVLAYVLFLVIPGAREATLLNTIYYGVVLCIFYSAYTLTMVTYYATFTEIVDTEEERTRMSNTKSVCDILYFILGYVVVSAMLGGMNVRLVALLVLPLVLTMLIPLFMIKEESTLNAEIQQKKTVKLIPSLRHTCKNKVFILWMCVYFFMTFGVQLFLGGINEYFSQVELSMTLVMGASFAPVPFTLMLYNKILRKKGFGYAFQYILHTYFISMLLMFVVGLMPVSSMKTVFAILSGLVCSFAIGALFSVAYSIPSQLAAEEEERTGISNSAMYFAVQGLFSGVATGIATGVVLVALKGTEGAHSDAIKYMTAISGLGTYVAALICTFFLPRSLTDMGRKE